MSLRRIFVVFFVVVGLTGCATLKPNDEKTRWYQDEFGTEAWIQFIEFDIDHRSKRIEDL